MQGPTWTPAQRAARIVKLVERNRSCRTEFLYEDAEWMRDAYLTRGLTLRQVATEAKCGLRTVARWMEIHGIATRKDWTRPHGKDHPRWKGAAVCPRCGGHRSYGTATCQQCRDVSGSQNPRWRGDKAEYAAVHGRIVAERGHASEYVCARCDSVAMEWAYDHSDPNEQRNQVGRNDGPYSLDITRYMPLCVTCHRRFDLGS